MPTQCSASGWVSGGTTGHGIDGYRFEPFRVREGQPWPRRHQNGDAHGRLFASVDEGSRFSLERGYSVVYRGPYAVGRKVHRRELARLHRVFLEWLVVTPNRAELIKVADAMANGVGKLFGAECIGARTHWSVGYWAAARKLRPDLFQPAERFGWSPAKREG